MTEPTHNPLGLPDAYAAARLPHAPAAPGLSLALLINQQTNPGKSPLVVLRSLPDALVCLGALLDAGDHPHRWVEIAFQRLDDMQRIAPVVQPGLTNHSLDERWLRQCETMRQAQPDAVLWTGYEDKPAPPMVLDTESGQVLDVSDDGQPLTLCTDERALAEAGLPAYGTTLHRYLWTGGSAGSGGADEQGGAAVFYPASADAPENAACKPLPFADDARYVDLNLGAGRLAVRSFLPVDYPEYVQVLNGKSWRGVIDGRTTLTLPGTVGGALHADVAELDADSGFGRIFLGRHGRRGRIIETFHLKLRCLADVVGAVHRHTQALGSPHLGLNDQSFRVQLAPNSAGLPSLWANRCELVEPAQAVRLEVGDPDTALYMPIEPAGTSIYRPALATESRGGQTMVRIRQVEKVNAEDPNPEAGNKIAVTVEATIRFNQEMDFARRDLVWLRLRPDQKAIDLFGYAEKDSALAPGEMRFRSLPFDVDAAGFQAVREAEGVSMPDCAFKVLPSLSSPCDLYSLGVLAVQTLLVNSESTLATALDEVLSLARWTAKQEGDAPLHERIKLAFTEVSRWQDLLGPHRIMDGLDSPQQATDLIPRELWYQALATILRMFPGACHESTCKDYSDAHPRMPHKVFEPTLAGLHRLITQSRGLIVIDWHYNREVHELLRAIRAGDSGSEG